MKAIVALLVFAITANILRAEDAVDYRRDIKPLLEVKCYACHGALRQESDLRLDAGVLIRREVDGEAVVIPGNASESPLFDRITAHDIEERMPPEGEGEALDAKQIALIRTWINQGALVPDDEPIPEDPRQHWAYQSVIRPDVPLTTDSGRSHPIDAFIASEHKRQGITPVSAADQHTLLRRLYFDLIGLPPTPSQIQEFLDDSSPGAWNHVIDQLLESPQYGERWARHWMDVWRYSDWDGFKAEVRGSQKHIWHWRDWIVNSLNTDKGYDRMVVEMLAGDEVAPNDPDVLAATGFLARNYHVSNRDIWLDATVEHTARAFLGMTLNCARCHDHKYDPIAQQEYYQFRAIFEPHKVRMDRLPGQPNLAKDGLPRAFDEDLTAATYLYVRGNEKQPDEEHPMTPAVPPAAGGNYVVEPVDLPLFASLPGLAEFAVEEDLNSARNAITTAEKKLNEAQADSSSNATLIIHRKLALTVAQLHLQSLEARIAADRAKHGVDTTGSGESPEEPVRRATELELEWKLRKAELQVLDHEAALARVTEREKKDDKKQKNAAAAVRTKITQAKEAVKKAQEAIDKGEATYTPLSTEYPRTSTGRRLALARWMTSTEHPLTARVAVNHIWARHFGTPLVDNLDDFGLRSPKPEHVELLNWLAAELMEHNWNMKHVHRLILTSQTWQRSSSAAAAGQTKQIDPDNRLLWRANIRRLDAEIVRDSVLAVSGQLDETMGGPVVEFAEADASQRRSLYVQHAYEKQATMLVLFDAASPNECYKRSESIIPQQALALANGSMAINGSRQLARSFAEEFPAFDDTSQTHFVHRAFLQLLSRPPTDEESNACVDFLRDQAARLSDPTVLTTFAGGAEPKMKPAEDPRARARENLIHVLMNHNDFITVR